MSLHMDVMANPWNFLVRLALPGRDGTVRCILCEAVMIWKKRATAYEMVHYGWACAASWQMLRHASVWEPAGRGRGRRDAVATQHRLTQAARHATVRRQERRRREREGEQEGGKRRAVAAIWHVESFLENAVRPPTPTSGGEKKGERS